MLTCGLRPGFEKFDYTTEGMTTFKKVYLGVGNSEVGEMLDHYFPEICKSTRMLDIGRI